VKVVKEVFKSAKAFIEKVVTVYINGLYEMDSAGLL